MCLDKKYMLKWKSCKNAIIFDIFQQLCKVAIQNLGICIFRKLVRIDLVTIHREICIHCVLQTSEVTNKNKMQKITVRQRFIL